MMALCIFLLILQCLNQTTGVHDIILDTNDREYNLDNDQISTVLYIAMCEWRDLILLVIPTI